KKRSYLTGHCSGRALANFELVQELQADISVIVAQADGRKFRREIPLHAPNYGIRLRHVSDIGKCHIAGDFLLQRNARRGLSIASSRDRRIDLELCEAEDPLYPA